MEPRERSQAAGFNAARIGAACEQVDAAARKVITEQVLDPAINCRGFRIVQAMDSLEWMGMKREIWLREINKYYKPECVLVLNQRFLFPVSSEYASKIVFT